VGPTLLERGHQPAFRPQVAVDAQSNATAVWAQITTEVLDGVPRRIFSVFRNVYTFETRGWGDAQLLEQSPFTSFGPSVAMNAAGQAAAAWSQWVGDYPGIFASRAAD